MPAIDEIDILVNLQYRRDLCARLLECSKRQMPLIADDDYTELLAVIGHKQKLLEMWDRLRSQQPDLDVVWRNRRDHLPTEDRSTCETLIGQIASLYEDLLETERRSTDSLTVRRDDAKKQLQNISDGAKAHHSYHDSLAVSNHRILDVNQ